MYLYMMCVDVKYMYVLRPVYTHSTVAADGHLDSRIAINRAIYMSVCCRCTRVYTVDAIYSNTHRFCIMYYIFLYTLTFICIYSNTSTTIGVYCIHLFIYTHTYSYMYIGTILVARMADGVEDKNMIQLLLYLSLFSILILFNYTLLSYTTIQYVIGTVLLFSFLNTLEGIIMALLSKLVSPQLAKGTFNSGM